MFFVFYFIKISKFALPGVMLIYERTSKDRKKERKCLGQDFWGTPEFQRDICKFWGTHQIHLIFTCKIKNSFPEISVHFYLNLSLISIVLAQEAVQITVK